MNNVKACSPRKALLMSPRHNRDFHNNALNENEETFCGQMEQNCYVR